MEPVKPAGLSRARYALFLSRSLHALSVSPSLYFVLVAVAWRTTQQGFTTIASIADDLGIDYTTVKNHTHSRTEQAATAQRKSKGSAHLFEFDRSSSPFRLTLSEEGRELLFRVHQLIERYAVGSR